MDLDLSSEFPPLTRKTIRKLREIKKAILEEPKRINMDVWVDSQFRPRSKEKPPCGTSACIAGHAVILDKNQRKILIEDGVLKITRKKKTKHGIVEVMDFNHQKVVFDFEQKGREILGLTINQAKKLFYNANWPLDLLNEYYRDHASGTAKLIELFIKTNGSYILPEKPRSKVTA